MNDDLNTSVALSVIFELVRLANKLLEEVNTTSQTLDEVDKLFRKLGGDVLGIVKENYGRIAIDVGITDSLVNIFIGLRNQARKNKNYRLGDDIRHELDKIGIILEDTPNGTVWRIK
jgi:cysteinyl-tRNA synthetase